MMIYANVGPDGVIVFEPYAADGLYRLPAGIAADADAERFKEKVSALARHSRDGHTLLVPGIPEASNQLEAVDALILFREGLEARMKNPD